MIRPYLSDIINDDKTPKNLRVHSNNEVIDYETQYGEQKIQLTMVTDFTSTDKIDNIIILITQEL